MFIRKNVLVNPFITDLKAEVILEPTRHMFRAQVKADQSSNPSPGRCIYERFFLAAPALCQFMGLLGPISFTIASEFSTDRGFVNLHVVGNFRLYMSCFQKYVNLVSLFMGKLRVGSHLCSFDFGRFKKYRCYCSLPLIPTFKVALES